MKMKTLLNSTPRFLAAGLLSLAAALPASAAAPPALQAQIVARPLTPGDKNVYKLPSSLEVSGGLKTVAVGTPVYLEADVNSAVPAADVTNITWAISSQPVGSAAVLLPSPLGTNVPIYEPADRSVSRVAARTLLRPDVIGQYQVTAVVDSASSGSTNLTLKLTVGTYVGVNTCALCHSGGVVAPDKVHPWQATGHSKIFTEGIDGLLGHYSQSCLACHTVGYDANTNAVNGGFDDIATQVGWTFPTELTNGNWAAMDPSLKNLANIQCENCHGPGSEHAASLGNTNISNWPRLSVTVNSGDCNQCHDAPTHHIKGTEWYISGHANTTRIPSGPTRPQCVG